MLKYVKCYFLGNNHITYVKRVRVVNGVAHVTFDKGVTYTDYVVVGAPTIPLVFKVGCPTPVDLTAQVSVLPQFYTYYDLLTLSRSRMGRAEMMEVFTHSGDVALTELVNTIVTYGIYTKDFVTVSLKVLDEAGANVRNLACEIGCLEGEFSVFTMEVFEAMKKEADVG